MSEAKALAIIAASAALPLVPELAEGAAVLLLGFVPKEADPAAPPAGSDSVLCVRPPLSAHVTCPQYIDIYNCVSSIWEGGM